MRPKLRIPAKRTKRNGTTIANSRAMFPLLFLKKVTIHFISNPISYSRNVKVPPTDPPTGVHPLAKVDVPLNVIPKPTIWLQPPLPLEFPENAISDVGK